MFNKRNKDKKKVPFLNNDAQVCSLAVIKKTGDNSYDKFYYGVAIGEFKKIDGVKYVEDCLKDNVSYAILSEYEVEKSIRNGDLFEDEPYCYSMYKRDLFGFKEIFDMENKEDIMKFLIDYNKKNNTILYWTFLDEEQKKEVDRIKVDNTKKYLEFNY